MTRLALYEKREHRDLALAEGYRERDYKAAHTLGGFLLGTFLFLLVYGGILAFVFYRYVTALHMSTLLTALFWGLILYVCLMFFYLRRVRRSAGRTYRAAHRKLEVYDREEKRLLDMYQEEGRPSDRREA